MIAICLKYAKERKAFGVAIAEFGAIQHKRAQMTIRTYAVESMMWMVVGLIENQLQLSAHDKSKSTSELKAVEEYAAECSMIKVYASETLDYVVDEGVPIHGYHRDYTVEAAYCDARINRIFEAGRNEITGCWARGFPRSHSNAIPMRKSLPRAVAHVQEPILFFHNSMHRNLVFTAKIALTSFEQLFTLSPVDG